MVDEYSGYSFYKLFKNAPTSGQVIDQMKSWFLEYGFPKKIRTDFGPQYRTEFGKFCHRAMIKEDQLCDTAFMEHQVSSAHNASSNGLAEQNLGSLKIL